ncbi:MAG TPA: MFS transporter [Solimonas sp.]|nr:MFS transporter [Solimonas sp.]
MTSETRAQRWRAALRIYSQPRILAMLFLGFSAGLPFLLVFSTLSAWLRDAHVNLGTIGLTSYILTAYSIKVLWAPVVDRLRLPLLSRALGRRRAWMLLAQCGIAAGLFAMSRQDPATSLGTLVWLALGTAFAGATQDIAIDAWRIEAAPDGRQDAMASAYQLGYRAGLLAASAGALALAQTGGWPLAYRVMAVLVAVGMLTTLLVAEPPEAVNADTRARERRVEEFLAARAHWPHFLRHAAARFVEGVVLPFVDFFARNGLRFGFVILAFVGCFRLTDITMGVMANPYYLDMGYSKMDIALIAKGYGVLASVAGIVIGGIAMARLGLMRALMLGGVLVILSNLAFASLSYQDHPSLLRLALVISGDNLAYNIAGTAFIAYMSGLTNTAYTATQYALFSSMFTLPGKLLAGGSGFIVESFGYPAFFVYTSLLGLPALALIAWLARRAPVAEP